MRTDVLLIHGSTQTAEGWRLLRNELHHLSLATVAVDLPDDQPKWDAGDFASYLRKITGLTGARVVIAHSGGGALLPAVSRVLHCDHLVWLAAYVPTPGISLAAEVQARAKEMFHCEWLRADPFANSESARTFLFHDVDSDVLEWALTTLRRFTPPAVLAEPAIQVEETCQHHVIVPLEDRTLRPTWMAEAAALWAGAAKARQTEGDRLPTDRATDLVPDRCGFWHPVHEDDHDSQPTLCPNQHTQASILESVIALNRERIGHVYPSYRYEVSREKVREYAIATGVGDPIYTADLSDVPDDEVPVPPTFAACFTLGRGETFADPELGVHANMVHGSQSFTFHRPLRIGDVLDCTPRITDIVDRGRMELLTVETGCSDAGSGEPVLDSRMVLIFFNTEA